MGFIEDSMKKNSIFVEVTVNPKKVRPEEKIPLSTWVHVINKVMSGPQPGAKVLRSFSQEPCTSTGRSGAGCKLCNMQDPLWHLLDKKNQTSRKGERVDFPKRQMHYIAVYEYTDSTVRILRGGNQQFKGMNEWYGSQKGDNQNLTRCDWQVWKVDGPVYPEYKSSREDASQFQVTPEIESQVKLVKAALEDELKARSMEELTKAINASLDDPSFDFGANVAKPPEPLDAGQTESLKSFQDWVASQKELTSGSGLLNILIPALQKVANTVNFNECTPHQLAEVKKEVMKTISEM